MLSALRGFLVLMPGPLPARPIAVARGAIAVAVARATVVPVARGAVAVTGHVAVAVPGGAIAVAGGPGVVLRRPGAGRRPLLAARLLVPGAPVLVA